MAERKYDDGGSVVFGLLLLVVMGVAYYLLWPLYKLLGKESDDV